MEQNKELAPLSALVERLENYYDFQCEGGPLRNCVEWQQLKAALRLQGEPPVACSCESAEGRPFCRIHGEPLYRRPQAELAPLAHQAEWKHVDAQPDGGYALRILRAYRADCDYVWSSTSVEMCVGGESNPLFAEMNGYQRQRAVELDAAIAQLGVASAPASPPAEAMSDMEYHVKNLCATAGNLANVTEDYSRQDTFPKYIQAVRDAVSGAREALSASGLRLQAELAPLAPPSTSKMIESRTREMEAQLKAAVGDTKVWCCRFHPVDWWHEVGCPHRQWSEDELRKAGFGHLIDQFTPAPAGATSLEQGVPESAPNSSSLSRASEPSALGARQDLRDVPDRKGAGR